MLVLAFGVAQGTGQGNALYGVSNPTVAVITHPVRGVEVYRLSTTAKGSKRVGNAVALSKAQIGELLAALHVPGELRSNPSCRPSPGFEFVFTTGGLGAQASMSLCLQCDVAQFLHREYNPAQTTQGYRGPTSVTTYQTDSSVSAIHGRLVKLVKQLFPKDTIVQGLK